MNYKNKIFRSCAIAVVMVIIFPAFLSRFGEWTKGIQSSFIVYGQSNSGTSSGPITTKVIPQIAVGSSDGNVSKYKTVIQVVNEGSTAATVTILPSRTERSWSPVGSQGRERA